MLRIRSLSNQDATADLSIDVGTIYKVRGCERERHAPCGFTMRSKMSRNVTRRAIHSLRQRARFEHQEGACATISTPIAIYYTAHRPYLHNDPINSINSLRQRSTTLHDSYHDKLSSYNLFRIPTTHPFLTKDYPTPIYPNGSITTHA